MISKQTSNHYSTSCYHQETSTAHDKWIEWADSNGVIAPSLIEETWVRTNAPQKSYRNKSLCVMLKSDCIHVYDWTSGEKFTLFDDGEYRSISKREQELIYEQLKEQAAKERQNGYKAAAIEALKIWNESVEAPVSGYFSNKGLDSSYVARWHQQLNCWIVLITDIDENIYTIQKIFNGTTPNKFYLTGGRIKGGMVIVGDLKTAQKVFVAEGISTGFTIRQETHKTVVCALSSGNLMAVCTAIRERFPTIEMVICADNDRHTEGNPGVNAATAAAKATGGRVAYPPLCEDCKCTDFNDAAMCKRPAP